mgnify:CR=1 FL=1
MTDYFDGLLKGKRFFFCDKDPLYTQKFKRILENSGIKVQQVPSPVCNPYAERFVKSIKDECLRNFVFLSEGMLHKAVSEYEIYYNTERPHQNLDNELISPKENEHYEELRLTREENKGKVLCKSAKGGRSDRKNWAARRHIKLLLSESLLMFFSFSLILKPPQLRC